MNIKVVTWGPNSVINSEVLEYKASEVELRKSELAARSFLDSHPNVKHVVYAIKYYNKADPYQLTLYKPCAKYMTDEDFEDVQNMKDVRVYALHNHTDTADPDYRLWKMTRFDEQTKEPIEFYVTARSFDEAIAKARKFHPGCCMGQVRK